MLFRQCSPMRLAQCCGRVHRRLSSSSLSEEQLQRLRNGPSLDKFVVSEDVDSEEPEPVATENKRRGGRLPLPPWLRTGVSVPSGGSVARLTRQLRGLGLSTVCEEARCPNVAECWGGETPTATIMLLGDTCTRACRFCSVKTSRAPPPPDPEEPLRTAKAIAAWGVDYVVMTSVDRDDVLPDFGAAHFAQTVVEVKRLRPSMLVEALTPDWRGRLESVEPVVAAGVDVYAHNLETVQRLTPSVRDPRATYLQSLAVLRRASELGAAGRGALVTKSSLMLGLGETDAEVRQAMRDLRSAGVEALTLGQYMQPSKRHLRVVEYVTPARFTAWEEEGRDMGFLYVAAGPLVRSSYRAGELYLTGLLRRRQDESAAATEHV